MNIADGTEIQFPRYKHFDESAWCDTGVLFEEVLFPSHNKAKILSQEASDH